MQRTPPAKAKRVSAYLQTAPSTTPQEAMDARQQAHINELTEQLRTAEHMSKKLREELAQAQVQMKAERTALQDQRLKEAQAWKIGMELTRASNKTSQARLLLLLDMERRNVLSGEDALRKERLARIQRDYNLTLFQQKESDLEERIIELQDMLEMEREARERDNREYEELREKFAEVVGKYGKLKGKFTTLSARAAEMHRDLEQSETKRGQLENDLSRLEEEVKNLKAESATLKSSLKRGSLGLDNIKNEKDELENTNAELKRSNADLKRQVDKWQSLGNRDGAEIENARKERIALEVKLRETEARLSEREQHLTGELEIREAKMEKFRARLKDYVSADKESREFIAQLEQDCEELKQTVAGLREKNIKLRAELSTAEQEIEIRNTVEREHKTKPVTIPDIGLSAEEDEPRPPSLKPKSSRKPKDDVGEGPSKPSTSKKPPPPEPKTESEEVDEAPKPKPRPKRVKKLPPKDSGESAQGSSRGKGKNVTEEDAEQPKPKRGSKKKPPVQEVADDSEVEVEAEPSKPKRKGKAKPTVAQESISVVPKKRPKAKSATDEEEVPLPKKKPTTKKAAGRPSAVSQRRDEEDEAEEEAKVKKKRKLKIFNSSQPSTFTWTFGTDKATNGLDIPTELSPMKEGEPTIPRAIFSARTSSSFMR